MAVITRHKYTIALGKAGYLRQIGVMEWIEKNPTKKIDEIKLD